MSIKPAKIYPFTLRAGESIPLLVQGSFWKVLSATGQVEVTGDSFGSIDAVMPGQGMRGYLFQRLVIRDSSGAANVVRLLIADEQFIDDRITGEVAVIDGNKARSIAGGAMTWRLSARTANAAMRPLSQVWNPPGSGRRLIVDSMVIACEVQNEMFWGVTDVKLASIPASRISDVAGMVVPGTMAQVWVDELPIYPEGTVLAGGLMVQPWSSVRLRFERPFVIKPGTGFIVGPGLAGVQKTAGAIEFFEESIL